MRRGSGLVLAVALLLGTPHGLAAAGSSASVVTYHGQADRSGTYVVPGLTWERAANLHRDPAFGGVVPGHIDAQPLYWRAPGSAAGLLIVATEDDVVYALDATSGAQVWRTALGKPVPRSALLCGNISPLGIAGTPVIDEAAQAVYLDAAVAGASGPQHLVFGLALRDGAILPGWPVDVGEALRARAQRFVPREQNERGALTLVGDRLFVPYGGHFGDCGRYHGWVVAVEVRTPQLVDAWSTRAPGGGVWAPGGIAFDGHWLFVATGNTKGASDWTDGEAVIRLDLDLKPSTQSRDFFTPPDWRELDAEDADLGGTNPLPLDVPVEQGVAAWLLALGKDGKAYLLDRENLGGVGGSLAAVRVSSGPVRTAPAAYRWHDAVFVAFQAQGSSCPQQAADLNLTVLRITASPRPGVTTAWCGALDGQSAPIVTTTEAGSDPTVWMAGAEGDGRLHGFRGDTGEPVFRGGGSSDAMTGLEHFVTIVPAQGRLYVAGDGRVYAFAF